MDEQLHRRKGRVRKEVEQQGRRVRVAWVRRVRRRTTGQCAAAGEGEDEGVDEGVDAAGEQGEARRRGAPLAGTANSSPSARRAQRPGHNWCSTMHPGAI